MLIIFGETERLKEEAVVAYSKAFSRYSSDEKEENHENL
jgi:hypothetical protein